MIKKVKVEQLKPGMFIHNFNCGWLQHPFISNQMKVKNEKIIEKIIGYGIREIYIDTDKGLDLTDAQTEEEVKQEIQTELNKLSEIKPEIENRVSFQKEIVKAREIKKEAKQIVQNIMEDVRLGRQVKVEKVNTIVEKMVNSIFRNKDALICLGRIKQTDEYTFLHSLSVCVLMLSFSKYLGFDYKAIHEIGVGGLLHDIGKMKVPLEVLNKREQLTEDEFKKIKEHVKHGCIILKQTPDISDTSILIAAQHHERADATGYPHGLEDEEISKYGHMASIVDVYDAITSQRCYRNAIEPTEALRKIFEWSIFHFNKEMVQHFIRCVGIYPIGSLVRLESGLLGVVIAHGNKSLLLPVVRIVYNVNKDSFVTPYDIDLSRQMEKGEADKIVDYESPGKWNINPQSYLN